MLLVLTVAAANLTVAPVDGAVDRQASGNKYRTESLRADVSKDIEAVETEWNIAISHLVIATSEKEKAKMRKQLPYAQTRMELAMKKRLLALDKSAS